MTMVRRAVTVAASRPDVWGLVAALDAVPTWNPGVTAATCGVMSTGVGATRTCHLRPGASIDEVVSIWRPDNELWLAVGRHGAIRSADMGWVLTDAPQATPDRPATVVEAIADYHMAFGPLGPVIDHLSLKRMLTRMLDDALSGLKHHLENRPNNEPAGQATP